MLENSPVIREEIFRLTESRKYSRVESYGIPIQPPLAFIKPWLLKSIKHLA